MAFAYFSRRMCCSVRRLNLQYRSTSCVRHLMRQISTAEPFFSINHANSDGRVLRLSSRGVLRVHGADSCVDLLQSLVTADLRRLSDGEPLVHTFMLNARGRVLFDLFVYRPLSASGQAATDNNENNSNQSTHCVYIDADRRLLTRLRSLLTIYRVRRRVLIDDCSDSVVVAALLDSDNVGQLRRDDAKLLLAGGRDPRCQQLGCRLLLQRPHEEEQEEREKEQQQREGERACELRHRLGVAEGCDEIAHGGCTPLEFNGDYSAAVSFDKGCYVGQELTARTHHTGVVRKRVMPLRWLDGPTDAAAAPAAGSDVCTQDGRKVGRLLATSGGYALALLRVDRALADGVSSSVVSVVGADEVSCRAVTYRPHWWPSLHLAGNGK